MTIQYTAQEQLYGCSTVCEKGCWWFAHVHQLMGQAAFEVHIFFHAALMTCFDRVQGGQVFSNIDLQSPYFRAA